MEWSEEDILKLIETYKEKSLLWDPKHADYYKKNLKEDAWHELGDQMKISAEQCRRKMLSLLASHRRERNKVKSANGTRKGTAKVYESRWFAYDAFKFLEDRDLPRKGTTTEMDGAVGAEVDIEERDVFSEQETTQMELERASLSSSPSPTKRARVEGDNSASMLKIAFNVLKATEAQLKRGPSQRNEIDSFFDYVKAKVHKYSPETQTRVQHAIFDILVKADKKMLDWSTTLSHPPSLGCPNSEEGRSTASPQFSQTRQEATPSLSEPSLMYNIKQSPVSSDDSRSFGDFV